MKKQIAILGSTGSIGTQALQVIEEHPDQYEAYVLTANNRVDDLIAQARKFKPEAVVIANETKYQQLKDALADLPIKVYAGEEALCQIVAETPIDLVLTAMVGYAGLKPTMNAIRARKAIALANKETLVVAGELINDLARFSGTPILPVDSEHSAVFQCLAGEVGNPIEKVILTASGGPFRTCTIEQLATVTKAQALKHPNWDMGAKITIDSASMMNKGFEVIEAKMAVRRASRPNRSGGTPAVRYSFDGTIRRRGGESTVGNAGYATAHSIRILLPGTPESILPAAGLQTVYRPDIRTAGYETFPQSGAGIRGLTPRRQYAMYRQCSQ